MFDIVAVGAIARKVIANKAKKNVEIIGALVQVGNKIINYNNWNQNLIHQNELSCPDKEIISTWEKMILEARKNGSSLGAIIEIKCNGVPPGLGEPI